MSKLRTPTLVAGLLAASWTLWEQWDAATLGFSAVKAADFSQMTGPGMLHEVIGHLATVGQQRFAVSIPFV